MFFLKYKLSKAIESIRKPRYRLYRLFFFTSLHLYKSVFLPVSWLVCHNSQWKLPFVCARGSQAEYFVYHAIVRTHCWTYCLFFVVVFLSALPSVHQSVKNWAGKVNKIKLIGWMHRWITKKSVHDHHQWWFIIIIIDISIIISTLQLFSARWELP